MDIERKIYDIRTWKKYLFLDISSPTLIHLSHRFISASKPAAWKSFVCCLNRFCTSVSTFSSSAKLLPRFSTQLWTALRDKHFHRKQEIFLYEYLFHWVLFPTRKMHNRTLLFGNTLLKQGCHVYYWNQPMNMRMLVSYLDCDEAGLCSYLVIHIENLLQPLQLFYFHLCPIYWLSLLLQKM
jgi:hypothetical protein